MSLNKVILIGNLGTDPEVRSTNDGTKLCNLRIATSESWKDRNGERKEKTEWHRIVIWGQNGKRGLVEICERFLKKGSKVYLEGQLQTRKWQDQSGADRYSTEIVLRGFDGKMVMLDGKAGDPGATEPDNFGGGFAGGQDTGDEIPFTPETRI